MRARTLVVAAAAAGLFAAGALAWTALREPSGGRDATPGPAPSAPPAPRTGAQREAADVADAVARGRLSAALAGVCAFLDRHSPEDLADDPSLSSSFEEARVASGRWGLGEAESLAASGEAAGAAAVFARAVRALRGTPAEAEAAPVEARLREAFARRAAEMEAQRRAGEEARRKQEVLDPLKKTLDAARAQAEEGGGEKALAELRAALKEARDPEARRLLEAAVGDLRSRLAEAGDRASKRRAADEAARRGDYERAREILQGLADAGGDGKDAAAAARDRHSLDGLKDLEENREPEAVAAVRRALRWMVKQQLTDGSFSVPALDGAGTAVPEEQRKKARFRSGITGLAALALLGHVRYDITDEFAVPLDRALSWIQAAQKADGSVPWHSNGQIYENAICALALVDADRLLHRTEVRPAAAKALLWLQEAQNADGGWKYAPRSPTSDTSVAGWALQALLHARLGAYDLKDGGLCVTRAFWYLDAMTDPATGRTGYQTSASVSPSMTAVALFCRLRNGMGPADDIVKKAADFLLASPPREIGPKGGKQDCYLLFYASDAMSRLGGDYWAKWGPALKKSLLGAQVEKGDAEGSWAVETDARASSGTGAVFLAAMNAMALENFFEHRE